MATFTRTGKTMGKLGSISQPGRSAVVRLELPRLLALLQDLLGSCSQLFIVQHINTMSRSELAREILPQRNFPRQFNLLEPLCPSSPLSRELVLWQLLMNSRTSKLSRPSARLVPTSDSMVSEPRKQLMLKLTILTRRNKEFVFKISLK